MPVISIVFDGFTERTYVDGQRVSERSARFENGGWTFHQVCSPGAPTGISVGSFGGESLMDESHALALMPEKPRKQKARKVGAQKEHRRPRKRHRRREKK